MPISEKIINKLNDIALLEDEKKLMLQLLEVEDQGYRAKDFDKRIEGFVDLIIETKGD